MKFSITTGRLQALVAILGAAGVLAFAPAAHAAVDADAAKALAKKNDCFKCHAIDKEKKGPSYKKISAKYKGKADGEEKVLKNMTTGPKVKLDDGTEEEHKIINTKDAAALKNLSDWILSQ
ncbi:MAG: c-type cytochrome [Burkholderiales bacterium]|nr:c-type cytochrome [Burkholderiales bacterium]